MASTPQVTGIREAMAALKEIDPKLRRETTKQIRKAIAPLQSAVRSRLPDQPLSGWTRGRYAFSQGSAMAGVKGRVGRGRGSRGGGSLVGTGRSSWPLISLEQRDAGGAVYDMAGRRSSGKSPQGRAFIRGLNRHARASRSMWPAAEQNLEPVQREVLRAIDEVAKQTNRSLRA